MVDGRSHILSLYDNQKNHQRQVRKKSFRDAVLVAVNELPYEVKMVSSETVFDICQKLGVTREYKWKRRAKKNYKKVALALRTIFNKVRPNLCESLLVNNELVSPTKCITPVSTEYDGNIENNDDIMTVLDTVNTSTCLTQEKVMLKVDEKSNSIKQICLGDDCLSGYRYLQHSDNVIEVVTEDVSPCSSTMSITSTSSTIPLELDLSHDESLLANDAFVTPTKCNIISATTRRELFPQNSSSMGLFEPIRGIDLFKISGKTREKFISPIKSPLKRLNERNFNKSPGEILPINSQNVFPQTIEGEFSECKFKEGQFVIPLEEWQSIYNDKQLDCKW